MGSHMSKKAAETNFHDTTTTSEHLTSYSAACQADETLRTFDATLQSRTSHAINTLASGVEVQALSFYSLREVTECLLEMNQEVVKVILDCKKDIWKNQELFDLVEEYFENSLQTLDFCTALEKCLKRVRDSQLLIMVALQQFEQEDSASAADGSGSGTTTRYARTLEDLKHFKEQAREPFTEEFLQIFQSVYKQQMSMLEKLQMRKNKLDKKLKYIHAWRRVSSIIFAASFAALLICSVVAAAVAAPPLAAALAAATSIPLGSMGKWIDSLWRSYETELKGQKEVIGTMQIGSYIAIKDLDGIRVLIDKLVVEIEGLVGSVDVAVEMEGEGEEEEEEASIRLVIGEIKKRLGAFMKNVEDLGVQADVCSRDIRKARTVVLQRIIKPPSN